MGMTNNTTPNTTPEPTYAGRLRYAARTDKLVVLHCGPDIGVVGPVTVLEVGADYVHFDSDSMAIPGRLRFDQVRSVSIND